MLFDKVVHFCKSKVIPLYVFEKQCGLGNGTIKGWISANPRIDNLQKVAKQMGITVEELLREDAG